MRPRGKARNLPVIYASANASDPKGAWKEACFSVSPMTRNRLWKPANREHPFALSDGLLVTGCFACWGIRMPLVREGGHEPSSHRQ